MALDMKKLKEQTRIHRRALHQIPETGFCEVQTSAYITDTLRALGYEVKKSAKTGVLAYRAGEEDGAVAFRADMDGLKMKEETDLAYASKIDGQMHACGHDGHMAILLGFAQHVAEVKKLKKGILFIFQPAEEGPGGAEKIIKEGVLRDYKISHVFGLHLYPGVEEGKIGIKSGAMMAQTGEFDVYIKAKSGHGAIPHEANDGIVAVGQLITSYQTIVSRNTNPIDGAVLTIGTIQGGERRNIIAENIRLEGTIRAFKKEVYTKIKDRMASINRGLMTMFDLQVEMVFRDMYPPVVNDSALLQSVMPFLPKDRLVQLPPMMISEDFSYYQEQVPSLFFILGSRNEAMGYTFPLHSSKFNFNEAVLIDGIDLYHRLCKGLNVY